MNERAITAKTDAEKREIFIRDNERTILKIASASCSKYITRSDDEWSVALLAFNKAIDIAQKIDNSLCCDNSVSNLNIDYKFYVKPRPYFPLIDSRRDLQGVVVNKRHLSYPVKENFVIIMAGGLGMRLRPYTEHTPKPLLRIDGVSILERLLVYFRYYGFRNFYISVHYLAEQIKNTIGDGSSFGINVQYLDEHEWLGTAGAISFIPRPDTSCVVSNADLFMDVDLNDFLLRHDDSGALGTMCTYRYDYQIAYGVVQSKDDEYNGIIEKPIHHFQVNTGLYCISPGAWDYLRENEKLDMPTLFDKIHSNHRKVCVYPHTGKWIDIGTLAEFERLAAGSK